MKISTKGRYALSIMFYLAKNYSDRYISLKEIAENEELSFKYLEKIMIDLNKNNYLDTLRGNNGGYRLKKEPKYYYIGEILKRVEGNILVVPCIDDKKCNKKSKCLSLLFFEELNKEINDFIDTKSLQDYIGGGFYVRN